MTKTSYLIQVPGLRLIGRSPGVPGKYSLGLCSMSRYSGQILICFIAYISNFKLLCGFGWEPYRTATMYRALCHCSSLLEWGCSSDNEISQHALLKFSSMKTLSGCYATDLVKLTDKPGGICSNVKFSVQEWMVSSIAYLWGISLYFSPKSRLISGMLE